MKYTYILLSILCAHLAIAQQITPKTAFLEKWEHSKEYLLAIATAMPEETYDYKPTEREMDFRNQLIHICENMQWLSTTYFSEMDFDRKTFTDTAPTTKAAIIALITASFDSTYKKIEETEDANLAATVDFFAGKKSKLQILNLLQDHVTHHRGQLIVYLNLTEIKPPAYVGW